MGIDPTQAVDSSQITLEILCNLCHKIMVQPVRPQCDHYFCNDCIMSWIDMESGSNTIAVEGKEKIPGSDGPKCILGIDSPKKLIRNSGCVCPKCATPISLDGLRPGKTIGDYIGKLFVYCGNRRQGCQEKMRSDELALHTAKCTFERVKCKLCGEKMLRRDHKQHREICTRPCPHVDLGCDFKGAKADIDQHLASCWFEKSKTVLATQLKVFRGQEEQMQRILESQRTQEHEIRAIEEAQQKVVSMKKYLCNVVGDVFQKQEAEISDIKKLGMRGQEQLSALTDAFHMSKAELDLLGERQDKAVQLKKQFIEVMDEMMIKQEELMLKMEQARGRAEEEITHVATVLGGAQQKVTESTRQMCKVLADVLRQHETTVGIMQQKVDSQQAELKKMETDVMGRFQFIEHLIEEKSRHGLAGLMLSKSGSPLDASKNSFSRLPDPMADFETGDRATAGFTSTFENRSVAVTNSSQDVETVDVLTFLQETRKQACDNFAVLSKDLAELKQFTVFESKRLGNLSEEQDMRAGNDIRRLADELINVKTALDNSGLGLGLESGAPGPGSGVGETSVVKALRDRLTRQEESIDLLKSRILELKNNFSTDKARNIALSRYLGHILGGPEGYKLINKADRGSDTPLQPPPKYIFVCGGSNGDDRVATVERYDPDTDEWAMCSAMDSVRSGAVAVSVHGVMYVIGGYDGSVTLDSCLMYDPMADKWTPAAPMMCARFFHAACVMDGEVYVAGGWDGKEGSTPFDIFEKFDPLSNYWIELAPLPFGRRGLTLTSVDGYIYAIGGYDGKEWLEVVDRYDPTTDTWSEMQNMLGPRAEHCAAEVNGKIYVMGGSTGEEVLNSMDMYNPVMDEWSELQDLLDPRFNFGAAVLNNKIYAIGGSDGEKTLDTMEVYDEQNDEWLELAPLMMQRAWMPAATGTDYKSRRPLYEDEPYPPKDMQKKNQGKAEVEVEKKSKGGCFGFF